MTDTVNIMGYINHKGEVWIGKAGSRPSDLDRLIGTMPVERGNWDVPETIARFEELATWPTLRCRDCGVDVIATGADYHYGQSVDLQCVSCHDGDDWSGPVDEDPMFDCDRCGRPEDRCVCGV